MFMYNVVDQCQKLKTFLVVDDTVRKFKCLKLIYKQKLTYECLILFKSNPFLNLIPKRVRLN